MKTIEVEAYVGWDDRDYFIFMPEKIGFVWEENIKKILLRAYPNYQIEEINNIFIKAINDYFSTDLNNDKISMNITSEGEKCKYYLGLDCVVMLPELPDYQFKIFVKMERLLTEERLVRYYDDCLSFINFMGNYPKQYTGE
ncbi:MULTISPECIES: hypothetical protein [unclassified Granulicatella]|uniref:hypothetical protein n=1 Tax=unclassified Granulicatella TaxID=2630493 RepID=UPI00107332AE|nr:MULTISPECIES: hypothetical protein [unclassified Granulicatella]MBF0781172.1 hypothetical protein [Granulicatella sp. 19428wC4_WM01]TFU91560.1 hypothetical protein E4T68_08870 [Granulicatella sp. WM01]